MSQPEPLVEAVRSSAGQVSETGQDRSVGDQRLSCSTKRTQDEGLFKCFWFSPPLCHTHFWPGHRSSLVTPVAQPHPWVLPQPQGSGSTPGLSLEAGGAPASDADVKGNEA